MNHDSNDADTLAGLYDEPDGRQDNRQDSKDLQVIDNKGDGEGLLISKALCFKKPMGYLPA